MFRRILWVLLALLPLCVAAQEPSFTLLNKGIRGQNTRDLLRRIEKDVVKESPDLVILMIGTNDLMNTHKMLSVEEYVANVEQMMERFTEAGIPLLMVSFPTLDEEYIYQRHDRSRYDRPLLERVKAGRDAVRQRCLERGVPHADFYHYLEGLGIPRHNEDEIIINEKNFRKNDGIHLTRQGNELLGEFVALHMQTAGLIRPPMKIVCFGDSITHSVFMKGAGTAGGETYLAYLRAALERMTTHR